MALHELHEELELSYKAMLHVHLIQRGRPIGTESELRLRAISSRSYLERSIAV